MIGSGKNAGEIYIIDFGLAKRYVNPRNDEHIQFKKATHFTGNWNFSSINTLKGNSISRRDDLESIGYILIFFLKGNLPWYKNPAHKN